VIDVLAITIESEHKHGSLRPGGRWNSSPQSIDTDF